MRMVRDYEDEGSSTRELLSWKKTIQAKLSA
jgi:hypothetical protein